MRVMADPPTTSTGVISTVHGPRLDYKGIERCRRPTAHNRGNGQAKGESARSPSAAPDGHSGESDGRRTGPALGAIRAPFGAIPGPGVDPATAERGQPAVAPLVGRRGQGLVV